MPQGKWPSLLNVRSVLEGTATARPGYGAPLNAAPFDQTNVHSVRRMNNSLPGANPTARRFVGAGTKTLQRRRRRTIDTGYSGDPLSLVVWRPDQSVEPWMYVGDSARMSKCRMNGATQTSYGVGIAPPRNAPDCTLDQPHYRVVQDFSSASGISAGGDAGSPSSVARSAASTIAGAIRFDGSGLGPTGWACIELFNPTGNYGWCGLGTILALNAGQADAEEVVVNEVHLQVSTSTIQGIKYDSGVQGTATVQAPSPLAGLDRKSIIRFTISGVVNTSGTAVTWVSGQQFQSNMAGQVIGINNLPYTILTVNSPTSITLTSSAGTQTGVAFGVDDDPSVISYTIGPDGLYSFRVDLAFTHVIGETLVGIPSFRCYIAVDHTGDTPVAITSTAIKSVISFSTGRGTLTETIALDLSQASDIDEVLPSRYCSRRTTTCTSA